MSKDLKIKKITNFLPFLAKNGIFCEMSTENDQKPLNMSYFWGFYGKKSKKNRYVFWEPCASKCLVKFQVFDFIAKIGKKFAFFGGQMTGNLRGHDHSFHLTCWTHILAKKWLPQRGKCKKMHISKNHQFFTAILTSLRIWLKI